MWGILAAVILYAIGILVVMGKEGIRENKSQTEWSMEELEKMKGPSVMGWRLLTVLLVVMGAGVLYYSSYTAVPDQSALNTAEGKVTKIHKSGSGDIEISVDGDKNDYILTNSIRIKISEKQLNKTSGKNVQISYRKQKSFLSKSGDCYIYNYQCDGKSIVSYDTIAAEAQRTSGKWIQMAFFFFAAAVITVAILLYAHVNPAVYKIICIYKPEKGIKPTVGQALEREINGIWEENFKSKITTSSNEKGEKLQKEQFADSQLVNNVTRTYLGEKTLYIVEMDEQTYAEYVEFLKFRDKIKQDS